LANQAEARIIRAAFAVISADMGMKAKFPIIRLVEAITQLTAFGINTMAVAGFPVKPKDYPSQRELIYTDIYICPVLTLEPTNFNSKLEANELFNDVRILLNNNLPLKDGLVSVTDAVVDLDWRNTILPKSTNGRIPVFVARYQKSIDVITGEFN
jgi:hypothetical protein